MRHTNRGYFDVDIELEKVLTESGMVDELFYFKDLRQRKLFLSDDITQLSVGEIIKHILQFNREDFGIEPQDRKPILLYVTSIGGEVDPGFALIDVILDSKTPVYTINLGYQYSMGFLIGLAGHRRYAMRHAKFLMHDGSSFVFNSGAKAQDQMEFNKRVEERVRQYVLSRSRLTAEEYDSKLRFEWYMFSDEAKDRGFVDYIIGEDRPLEDIV